VPEEEEEEEEEYRLYIRKLTQFLSVTYKAREEQCKKKLGFRLCLSPTT